jgi:kinesin family protein C1
VDLEAIRRSLEASISTLRTEKEEIKLRATELAFTAEQTRRLHDGELDDLQRKQRHELDDVREEHRREIERLHRAATNDEESVRKQAKDEVETLLRNHQQELADLEKQLKSQIEEERVCFPNQILLRRLAYSMH